MGRWLARAARVAAVAGAAAIALAARHHPPALASAGALAALALLVWVWLPRAAHRAFRGGRFDRAARLYALQRAFRFGAGTRGQLAVSRAACALGRGDTREALERLEGVDRDGLGEAARAAWANNRAYARGRLGVQLEAALADADEALARFPDVAGFRHTRGLVLLSLGRASDAILEFDRAWRRQGDPHKARLEEAERCYDLGSAWLERGEPEYAADYFARAERAAPGSAWAKRAAERAPAGWGAEPPRPLAQLL